MNPFIEQALLIKDELINYRRIIHENPEVGEWNCCDNFR